jgi:hypothetical protein
MYKYKCWQTAAVRPVATPDEERPPRVPPRSSVGQTPSTKKHKPSRPSPPHPVHNLRPHVPAADRLRLWSSPHSLAFFNHLQNTLPDGLAPTALDTILASFAPSTRSSYGAGLLRFNEFCDRHRIPESDRMPASYALIVTFVGEYKGSVSGRTIKLWLSALRAWHNIHRAPWLDDDPWLHMARTTALKEGAHLSRPPRPPVTTSHLLTLHKALNLSDPRHAAIWACACAAFWGCRRLGELLVVSSSSFDPSFHLARSASISYKSQRGYDSASIHLPWTKTTKQDGGTLVLTGRPDLLCPVRALRNHLKVNHNIPPSAPFFSFCKKSSWSTLTKSSFIDSCTRIWRSSQLTLTSGHAFRIGGASELLLAGTPPEVVASLGGWTSLSFLLYWRRIEEILPLHISQAYSRQHVLQVSESIELFCSRSNVSLLSISDQ